MIYQDYLNQQDLQRYASSMNARAKQLSARGRVTVDGLRDRIFESGGCCEWCGVSLVNQAFELDHIYGLSQQGANTMDNLVVTCPDCNRRKSKKHPARFASEIYSETGHKTRLVDRILQDHEIEPTTQLSLFDNDPQTQDVRMTRDDNLPSTPPYNWSS